MHGSSSPASRSNGSGSPSSSPWPSTSSPSPSPATVRRDRSELVVADTPRPSTPRSRNPPLRSAREEPRLRRLEDGPDVDDPGPRLPDLEGDLGVGEFPFAFAIGREHAPIDVDREAVAGLESPAVGDADRRGRTRRSGASRRLTLAPPVSRRMSRQAAGLTTSPTVARSDRDGPSPAPVTGRQPSGQPFDRGSHVALVGEDLGLQRRAERDVRVRASTEPVAFCSRPALSRV